MIRKDAIPQTTEEALELATTTVPLSTEQWQALNALGLIDPTVSGVGRETGKASRSAGTDPHLSNKLAA